MKKFLAIALLISSTSLTSAFAEAAGNIPAFKVEFSFTQAAKDQMKASNDALEIDVYYVGVPKEGDKTPVNEDGQIELVEESQDVGKLTSFNFGNVDFDSSLLDHTADHEVHVLINVNSSKADDTVLDCDVFEDKISVATAAPVKLSCDYSGG